MKKGKSLSGRILESFRELKDSEAEEDHHVNKVVFESYMKNNKEHNETNKNNKNLNIIMNMNDKDPNKKLSRRSTSVSSFLKNKKSNNLITSFMEMNNYSYKKQVRIKKRTRKKKLSLSSLSPN